MIDDSSTSDLYRKALKKIVQIIENSTKVSQRQESVYDVALQALGIPYKARCMAIQKIRTRCSNVEERRLFSRRTDVHPADCNASYTTARIDPEPALLVSMALQLDPNFRERALESRQDCLNQARRIHSEVVGTGAFKPHFQADICMGTLPRSYAINTDHRA